MNRSPAKQSDVLIIGSGAAGLTAALTLAETKNVLVLAKAELADPRTLEITCDRDKASAGQVLALVQQHGYAIEDVTTREPDFEDVFVRLTTGAKAAA